MWCRHRAVASKRLAAGVTTLAEVATSRHYFDRDWICGHGQHDFGTDVTIQEDWDTFGGRVVWGVPKPWWKMYSEEWSRSGIRFGGFRKTGGKKRQRSCRWMLRGTDDNFVTKSDSIMAWKRCPLVASTVVCVAAHLSDMWGLSSAVYRAGHAGRVSGRCSVPEEAPALLCFPRASSSPSASGMGRGKYCKDPRLRIRTGRMGREGSWAKEQVLSVTGVLKNNFTEYCSDC